LAERLLPLLGPPAPTSFEGLVTALINQLTDQPGDGEALLVLADHHLIDAQPAHGGKRWSTDHGNAWAASPCSATPSALMHRRSK
jgi:LuxR family maltose regulon positive regulatory protein